MTGSRFSSPAAFLEHNSPADRDTTPGSGRTCVCREKGVQGVKAKACDPLWQAIGAYRNRMHILRGRKTRATRGKEVPSIRPCRPDPDPFESCSALDCHPL